MLRVGVASRRLRQRAFESASVISPRSLKGPLTSDPRIKQPRLLKPSAGRSRCRRTPWSPWFCSFSPSLRLTHTQRKIPSWSGSTPTNSSLPLPSHLEVIRVILAYLFFIIIIIVVLNRTKQFETTVSRIFSSANVPCGQNANAIVTGRLVCSVSVLELIGVDTPGNAPQRKTLLSGLQHDTEPQTRTPQPTQLMSQTTPGGPPCHAPTRTAGGGGTKKAHPPIFQ